MASKEYADLILHRHELPLGHASYTAEWKGSARLPVIISERTLQLMVHEGLLPSRPSWWPTRLLLFGIPLRFVSADGNLCFIKKGAVYARTDGVNILSWCWWRVVRAFRLPASFVYHRLILTLMVWGLASVPLGAQPSWRDIGRKKKHGTRGLLS